MKLKGIPILLLLLVSLNLILSSCASSKSLRLESQQRATTIAYNAQKISDADAAVACYDMLTRCEQSLADTTAAYHQLKKNVPSLQKKARNKGFVWGVGAGVAVWLMLGI